MAEQVLLTSSRFQRRRSSLPQCSLVAGTHRETIREPTGHVSRCGHSHTLRDLVIRAGPTSAVDEHGRRIGRPTGEPGIRNAQGGPCPEINPFECLREPAAPAGISLRSRRTPAEPPPSPHDIAPPLEPYKCRSLDSRRSR